MKGKGGGGGEEGEAEEREDEKRTAEASDAERREGEAEDDPADGGDEDTDADGEAVVPREDGAVPGRRGAFLLRGVGGADVMEEIRSGAGEAFGAEVGVEGLGGTLGEKQRGAVVLEQKRARRIAVEELSVEARRGKEILGAGGTGDGGVGLFPEEGLGTGGARGRGCGEKQGDEKDERPTHVPLPFSSAMHNDRRTGLPKVAILQRFYRPFQATSEYVGLA